MRNIILILGLLMLTINVISAQKYFTKTGEISFYSHTPMEDIEAISNSASTVFDLESGKIQWAVLVKSFEFEKALMQEHFNENYMESSTYPKASFKGEMEEFENLDLSKDGETVVNIKGTLTIHGVDQQIETNATFKVENGIISASSKLTVLVNDYNIEVPSLVSKNIAEQIEITINAEYALL